MPVKPQARKAMSKDQLQQRVNEVRTGGKGSVRRKRKIVHKSASGDDKKVMQTLQHLPHFTPLSGIEEANIFTKGGEVIHFENPKVCASQEAATLSISGHNETKKLQELLPGILSQLGLESMMNLKNLRDAAAAAEKPAEEKPAEEKKEEEKKEEAAPAAEEKKEEEKKN